MESGLGASDLLIGWMGHLAVPDLQFLDERWVLRRQREKHLEIGPGCRGARCFPAIDSREGARRRPGSRQLSYSSRVVLRREAIGLSGKKFSAKIPTTRLRPNGGGVGAGRRRGRGGWRRAGPRFQLGLFQQEFQDLGVDRVETGVGDVAESDDPEAVGGKDAPLAAKARQPARMPDANAIMAVLPSRDHTRRHSPGGAGGVRADPRGRGLRPLARHG